MSEINNANYKKPAAITALLLLLLICFFNKETILHFFRKDDSATRLAKVTSVRNEVRKKKTSSLNWNSASVNDSIHRGDSISTGSVSTARVQFNNGQTLGLDQNTLIVFDDQADTPEFVTGNIKLTVNGSMKMKIDNEIIMFNGKNADIQIYKDLKSQKPKIVLLKGNSSLTSTKSTRTLLPNKVADVKEVQPPQPVALPKPVPPKPPVEQAFHYKLYDFYKRANSESLDFILNKNFVLKPLGQFEIFSTALLQFKNKIELNGSQPTRVQFKITDSIRPIGYVVELSQTADFSEQTTKYFWARSQFEYPFEMPGTYFLRYRKVLANQHITQYSPSEKLTLVPKMKLAKVVQKPKVIAIAPPKIQPPDPVIQLAPIERQPAAVQEAQSVIKIGPDKVLYNLKFSESYASVYATQGYLVSNRVIENSRPFQESYNLGFNILHWNYNHGYNGQLSKSITSKNSTNSVLLAELNYLYRVFVAAYFVDGDRVQFTGMAGYELYQNSNNTSDFVSSYNLFKIGLGASVPIFSFWAAELDLYYGMGTSSSTSFQLNSRLNYYLKPNLSLGLGFKARKYDFVLLNKKNMESFSETFTSLRYHY